MMLSSTVLTIFPLFFQKRFAALPAGRLPYKGKLRSADLADKLPLVLYHVMAHWTSFWI